MNLVLKIPNYYKNDIDNLKGDISINQFIINALAEKISALKTLNYLEERANRASLKKMLNLLDKVQDIEPQEYDKY